MLAHLVRLLAGWLASVAARLEPAHAPVVSHADLAAAFPGAPAHWLDAVVTGLDRSHDANASAPGTAPRIEAHVAPRQTAKARRSAARAGPRRGSEPRVRGTSPAQAVARAVTAATSPQASGHRVRRSMAMLFGAENADVPGSKPASATLPQRTAARSRPNMPFAARPQSTHPVDNGASPVSGRRPVDAPAKAVLPASSPHLNRAADGRYPASLPRIEADTNGRYPASQKAMYRAPVFAAASPPGTEPHAFTGQVGHIRPNPLFPGRVLRRGARDSPSGAPPADRWPALPPVEDTLAEIDPPALDLARYRREQELGGWSG
ncbi:hypothetical protein FHS79_002257 [Polymorphobacter multimanifer]|uniref:Uncharacterized protein n=2 Tax=Polymorphobacter multimanifer TaxID=1070431 RepID=A0A841LFW4_9SPHN|nr:hypothetical protein [Polymorphobacter multimanifer]MBB6228072.1 hypothetical protein [Polymorphobacter multimanifer]